MIANGALAPRGNGRRVAGHSAHQPVPFMERSWEAARRPRLIGTVLRCRRLGSIAADGLDLTSSWRPAITTCAISLRRTSSHPGSVPHSGGPSERSPPRYGSAESTPRTAAGSVAELQGIVMESLKLPPDSHSAAQALPADRVPAGPADGLPHAARRAVPDLSRILFQPLTLLSLCSNC